MRPQPAHAAVEWAHMSFAHARQPIAVAIVLAAGIAAAPVIDLPRSVAFVLAIALVAAGRWTRWAWLAAVAAAGLALGARTPLAIPAGVTLDDRSIDVVTGSVAGLVVKTRRGWGARLATNADAVWIWTTEAIAPGERIAVHGRLVTPRGALGPGQPDRDDALAARGARLELTATQIERLADEPGLGDRVWRWAAATQATWSARIDRAGGDAEARAALRGIVVGDRAAIPESLDARWRAVGVFHVLSVSGLHLAVVAGLAFSLLRRLAAASPWGGRIRTARWAAPPALAFAIAYTLVTGAQIATLRALVVVTLVLVGQMLDRPLKLLDAIGVAGICILAWRPADLFDPSFQLSFVAAIALATIPQMDRGWIVRGFVSTVWVTLATAPLTAYHFHQVTPGGVIGNLVLTPLLELVALPLALAGVALDWAVPIHLATLIVGVVDHVAALLEHAMPIGKVAIASQLVVLLLLVLSLVLSSRTWRRFDALAVTALCIVWSFAAHPLAAGNLRVTFLDIGQGDAAIVELPDGGVWLVDANAPGRTIGRTLAVYGKREIDLAVISHPHPDHYAGLATLDVPVAEIWSAREAEPRDDATFAAAVARIPLHTHPPLGVARSRAGVELVVWAPRYAPAAGAAETCATDPVRTVNDNSLVVELRYRGRSILFAGDLEAEGEQALVDAGVPRVDIVKVAHHGSPTSSTPAFIAATSPTLAVISCGRANHFGFPSPAVVDRWRAAGANVARTDTDGAVTVVIDPAGNMTVERFVE